MLQLPEVQEFVAEARERHALMTTRRARRYQRGSLCKSENGEIWYGKYYPAPGAPQKRVQLGRSSEMNEKQARTALDDMMALLNRNPAHALGAEPVRRFVEQVYIPQKYENGDWRKATGQEAEYLFRRSILPEIGELRCRDLKAEHLRAVLRKLAGTGLSYESVSKVRFAMGDMVKRMVAEEYLTSNIAAGLKTPKTARRSDRSRLRRVTLAEYLRAWTVLDERERLAFDLVTFCGLRESEAYGLKNGDLFQQGAIRVQRSWYKGDINPTKTDEIREVGVGSEIFERLMAWIATLPEGNKRGVGLSERADRNAAAAGQRPAPMHPSALGAAGTRLDQLRGPATVAFHSAPGKRHRPEDHCGSAGARPRSSSWRSMSTPRSPGSGKR